MSAQDERQAALARAYRLLSIRSRSEKEMRRSLEQAGFSESIVEEALAHLLQQGFLDDSRFATDWTESRMNSRPRGRRLIEHELRVKGVDEESVAAATSAIDDDSTAMALAAKRARLMRGLDRQTFIRRLSNYLRLRGFSGDTIAKAVAAALEDRGDS